MRVRFAALLDEAVVFVWVTSAVGRDISRDSIQQGGEAARDCGVSVLLCCGGVLLSHNPSVAVPSALPGLASRFGMLLGVSPVL